MKAIFIACKAACIFGDCETIDRSVVLVPLIKLIIF